MFRFTRFDIRQSPRLGDIGEESPLREYEPVPESVPEPVLVPTPEPAPAEPEPVPA